MWEKFLNEQSLNTEQTIQSENPNKIFDDLTDLLNLATNQKSQGVAYEHQKRYEQQQQLNQQNKKTNLLPFILLATVPFFLKG